MERSDKQEKRPPNGVCKHFWKTGSCQFANCKFKHEQPPPVSSNNNYNPALHTKEEKKADHSSNNNTDDRVFKIPPFYIVLGKDFRSQHDMRKFVLAALTAQSIDDVILELGSPSGDGVQKLRQIMQAPFSIKAGNAKNEYSFQRIAVPLCSLLTQPSFKNSTHVTELKIIYAAVLSEVIFFKSVCQCLQDVLKGGKYVPERVEDNENSWNPLTWQDVLRPFVDLLFLLLTRLTDAAAQEEPVKWFNSLQEINSWFPEDKHISSCLSKIYTILTSARKKEAKEAEAKKKSEEIVSLQVALSLQTEEAIPVDIIEQPGPGDIHPDGPRHDNDHADFRKIKVLPTYQEIMCKKDPYLPLPDGSEHVPHPVDRYLDIQFRLLREDMLAAVKLGISGFLEQKALKKMGPKEVRYTVKSTIGKDDDSSSNAVSLYVYRNVEVSAPKPSLFKGIWIEVTFSQLPSVANKKRDQRKAFWEYQAGSRQLDVDSLVCIALGVSKENGTVNNLIFATVAKKDVNDLLGDDTCKVTLRLLDLQHIAAVMDQKPLLPGEENVMLQVRGHFFPVYQPVLEALQAHTADTLPFADILAGDPNIDQTPPKFIQENTEYDLSMIVQPHLQRKLRAPVFNYEELRYLLHQHKDSLILDASQIDAFASSLTREVSLIQGPPGTGKTYIGIQIVRALLGNSSGTSSGAWLAGNRVQPPSRSALPSLNPILCICYTNHALDQFLEGLIKGGIPLDKVVRAGGRSKSDTLAGRALHNLINLEKSKAERRVFQDLKKSANELETTIDNLFKTKKEVKPDDLMQYIEYAFSEHFDSVNSYEGHEEGFEVVGGAKTIFNKWLNQLSETDTNNNNTVQDTEVDWELIDNVWDLNHQQRRQLYNFWVRSFQADLQNQLDKAIAKYNACIEKNRQLNDAAQLRILRQASIIGFTTSGCAKYQQLLKALQPKVVICEEAGEVLESHILASLTSGTEQLILIGDHLQLRPKVTEYSLSVDSRNGFNLDISLFERLVKKQQSMHKGKDLHELGLLCTLNTQRRMRPDIAELIRQTLYPKLEDHKQVTEHPHLVGFEKNLWFFDHNWRENTDTGEQSVSTTSYFNHEEARMVVELVRYAVRQGYQPDQIAVLTPYVGQLLALKKLLAAASMLLHLEEQDLLLLEAAGAEEDEEQEEVGPQKVTLNKRVRLSTVDNFQGEEAELVIISSVRSNSKGRTGFLKIENRVNVMLSRAKHGMIILGSASTIKKSYDAKMFHNILKLLESKGAIGNHIPLKCKNHQLPMRIEKAEDFRRLSPDGGCQIPCAKRLKCGHVCKRLCHPDDTEHVSTTCNEPCQREIPECGHPCNLLCSQKCGGCKELVKMTLPCGHTAEISCGTKEPQCSVKLTVTMPLCNHQERLTCSQYQKLQEDAKLLKRNLKNEPVPNKSLLFACTSQCGVLLDGCNHPCKAKCGTCTHDSVERTKDWKTLRVVHKACKTKCDRLLFCGHICSAGTCHGATDCPPCSQKCFTRCSHSVCPKQCRQPCVPCVEECRWACTCEKKLVCKMICGAPCIRLPCDARCNKNLSCGHRCTSLCGEKCPSKDYCKQCSPANIRSQQVDFIMMSTFEDHDPDESPLLVLNCGHYGQTASDGICLQA